MDTHLAGGNCLDLIDEILSHRPETEIIILSDDKDNEHFLPAIRHGARGYLRKDVPTTELVKSIQVLTKDQVAISREMIRVLMDEVHRLGDIETNGTESAIPDRLTPREKEVLQYLIEGFTNNEIAVQLSIAENTVRVHVGSILRKLKMKNRREIYQFYSHK
jgi:two-component system nitrate/nitrite response regulator NarL